MSTDVAYGMVGAADIGEAYLIAHHLNSLHFSLRDFAGLAHLDELGRGPGLHGFPLTARRVLLVFARFWLSPVRT